MKKDNHLIENIEEKGDLRGESETRMVARPVDKILQKTKKKCSSYLPLILFDFVNVEYLSGFLYLL